jgi:hypothetical protein
MIEVQLTYLWHCIQPLPAVREQFAGDLRWKNPSQEASSRPIFPAWDRDGRGKEGGAVLTVPLNSELQQAGTGRLSGRLDDLGRFFFIWDTSKYGFYSWCLEILWWKYTPNSCYLNLKWTSCWKKLQGKPWNWILSTPKQAPHQDADERVNIHSSRWFQNDMMLFHVMIN